MSKTTELDTLINFDGDFDRETHRIMKLWFEYMHSNQRILPNAPSTLLSVWVEYFDADWIGLIDIDEECGTWSVKCFFNRQTGSFSETTINPEGENLLKVPHWIESVRANDPIYVADSEELKDTCPEEYEICKRFRMKNVLGIPYRNCRFGFMVVKNPRKHEMRYDILNLMCSLLTHEINDAVRRKAMEHYNDGFEPASFDEVNIYLYGEFVIRAKGLYMAGADVGNGFIRFIIAILTLNPDRCFTGAELAEIYFGETPDGFDAKHVISRFRAKYKEQHPLHDDRYELIKTIKGEGYRINPDINVVTDVQMAREQSHIIRDTLDMKTKLELLEKWYKCYRGSFLQGAGDDSFWIVEKRVAYEEEFLEYVLEYLSLLIDTEQYALAEKKANKMLTQFPGNYNFYMIKLASQMKRKKFTSLSCTLMAAMKALSYNERQVLFSMIFEKYKLPENHHNMIKASLNL